MMMTFSICAVYSQHTFYQILLLYLQWNPSCDLSDSCTRGVVFQEGWSLIRSTTQYIYNKIKRPLKRGWPLNRVGSQKGFHFILKSKYLVKGVTSETRNAF